MHAFLYPSVHLSHAQQKILAALPLIFIFLCSSISTSSAACQSCVFWAGAHRHHHHSSSSSVAASTWRFVQQQSTAVVGGTQGWKRLAVDRFSRAIATKPQAAALAVVACGVTTCYIVPMAISRQQQQQRHYYGQRYYKTQHSRLPSWLRSDETTNAKEGEKEEIPGDNGEGNAREEEKDADVVSTGMISALGFYKAVISPLLPPACRFLPTCSQYGVQAIQEFGPGKGSILIAWRLMRCSPLGGKGIDYPKWPPVPFNYGSWS